MVTPRISMILLSGGKGTRMGNAIPKQYLSLHEKPICRYSFELFLNCSFISEIIVVCDPTYQSHFQSDRSKPIKFAISGETRQDSVCNGFKLLHPHTQFVCTHDAARPLLKKQDLLNVLEEGKKTGAATLAFPVKYTIKEADPTLRVQKTLDRSRLWEIQTPQVISYELLKNGLELLKKQNLTVTDDLSLIEHLGLPAKLVKGSESNIKITNPVDLLVAAELLNHEKMSAIV